MPPVSGIDAESSANASAPQRTINPPSTHTPIIHTGSGTRVAMPAGRAEDAAADGDADYEADRAPQAEPADECRRHGRILSRLKPGHGRIPITACGIRL